MFYGLINKWAYSWGSPKATWFPRFSEFLYLMLCTRFYRLDKFWCFLSVTGWLDTVLVWTCEGKEVISPVPNTSGGIKRGSRVCHPETEILNWVCALNNTWIWQIRCSYKCHPLRRTTHQRVSVGTGLNDQRLSPLMEPSHHSRLTAPRTAQSWSGSVGWMFFSPTRASW